MITSPDPAPVEDLVHDVVTALAALSSRLIVHGGSMRLADHAYKLAGLLVSEAERRGVQGLAGEMAGYRDAMRDANAELAQRTYEEGLR